METFVNDTIRLTVNTNIDISGYATIQIRYRKPDGATGCWTATICPTDNECMYYDLTIGDLDQVGEWLIQGIALDAGAQLTGQWCSFYVHDPLVEFCTTVAPTTAAP
jgi:hypothetical protein